MDHKRKLTPKSEPSSEEEVEEEQTVEESSEPSDEEVDPDGEEDEEEESGEEEEEEPSNKDFIKKLLEPFGKDQLIDLLKEAAIKNPSLVARIFTVAKSDPVHRKIFVFGLGWDTATDTLASFFSQYGEIEECKVVCDWVTGKSKGYAFILFRTRAGARKALKEPQKKIGNRMTSSQLASFGAPSNQDGTGKKLFVGNVGANVNPERLQSFFANFGEIEEGPLGYDRVTGMLRGFAIFVYRTVEGCNKALEEPNKIFEGNQLKCRRALEGLKSKTPATVGVVGAASFLQPNDLALTYASASMIGLNRAVELVGQSLNPAAALVGQNSGFGALNSVAAAYGMSPSVNPSGTTPFSYGMGLGFGGGGSGINSISPSVIGSYGSQAALQGLGAYQSGHLSSTAATRSHYGIGSIGAGLPQYLGR